MRATAANLADDAAARKVMESVISVYRSMERYADEGTLILEREGGASPVRRETSFRFAREGDRKWKVECSGVWLVSDGTSLMTVLGPTGRHLTEPAPPRLAAWHVTEGPVGAMLLGGPGGPIGEWLVALHLDPARAERLLSSARGVQGEPGVEVNGQPCAVVRVEGTARAEALRFTIDREGHLIRAIELLTPAVKPEDGGAAGKLVVRWESGAITAGKPLDSKLFEVKSPGDSVAVTAPKAREKAAVLRHPLLDKPAPAVEVRVLNDAGKPVDQKLADLTGQVVVLDFWTTWCPPCRIELPELAGLADEQARAKAKVVFLAVSQDEQPEAGNLESLVRGTLEELGVKSPALRVAIDPERTLGEAFGVEAYPTVVVIDAAGVVRQVVVGYTEESVPGLKRTIEGLLKGAAAGDAGDAASVRPRS
jgi:thiol-disulfide isomerase/thioredoxin